MQYYDYGYFDKDSFILFGNEEKFWNLLEKFIYIVPKNIIDDVRTNCVFLMIDIETLRGGCFIHKKLLINGKSVIAFHDMLYLQSEDEKANMILHEIAHYVLDHCGEVHFTDNKIEQEKAADTLKDEWIADWEKHLKTQEEKTRVF